MLRPVITEAIFAMGCFWCAESEFRDHETNQPLPGILSLTVGYAGGTKPMPTYENHEGYKEALKIVYNPDQITYQRLLEIFWHNIDPFNNQGQFCDSGFAYTSVIFFTNQKQQSQALEQKQAVEKLLGQPVVTEILPYTTFFDAETYHQNYAAKNPITYKYYRWNCGRDKRLKQIWGDR